MMLEFYFKNPVRPVRLGEQRRADKTAEFNYDVRKITEMIKNDPDFDNVLYVRLLDENGRRLEAYPRKYGFELAFREFNDLLKFLPDFIKEKVTKNTGPMVDGIKSYLLYMSDHGYVYGVEQCSNSDIRWKLYEDRGN